MIRVTKALVQHKGGYSYFYLDVAKTPRFPELIPRDIFFFPFYNTV